MADVSKIKIESDTYNIKDSTARAISNYSNNEQVIGTWTNGKPLYRKVYNTFTYLADVGNNYIILDTNTNINIINSYGSLLIKNSLYTLTIPTENYGLDKISSVYKNETSGDIYLNTSLTQSDINNIQIVLEYTKSSD